MPAGGDETQPADRGERLRAQLGVKDDADPLAALAEIERPLVAAIAVVFEDQPLDAELHALGIIGAGRDMRAPAALVVDRHHDTVLDLDQIEPGDQPEPVGGQRHRAGMEALVVADSAGSGNSPAPRSTRRCTPRPSTVSADSAHSPCTHSR